MYLPTVMTPEEEREFCGAAWMLTLHIVHLHTYDSNERVMSGFDRKEPG
jgi:hypothetical protein